MPAEALRGEGVGFRNVRLAGRQMRLAAFDEEGATLRLVASYDSINRQTRNLIVAFLLALPVTLGFLLLGGRWIAHQAVAPIQEIIDTAEHITAQHFAQRLPVPPARDELQRLATVLNATLDRLDEGFRQAARFTADASHELKTPLTVLRTSVEALLRSPELSAGDQRAVAGLLEQTKRLSSITASLLLLSRADVGRLDLDLAPGDLAEIVSLCVDDARIIAEAQRIEIEMTLPATAPALVDRTRAAQIVMNLLDNAVKFNLDGGRVRVTLDAESGHWALRIANTGPGIRPGEAAQLFTRFYRGEHTAATSGHGLGLSLSRELARAHRGDLQLAASEDGWTTFLLTIPTSA
jgi:signal transduction histidine kinase